MSITPERPQVVIDKNSPRETRESREQNTNPADVHLPHTRIEQQLDRQTIGYDPNKHEELVIAAQSGQLDPDLAAEVLRREQLSNTEAAESAYDLGKETLPDL